MTKTTNLTIAEFGAQSRLSPKVIARLGADKLAKRTDEQLGLELLREKPKYWAVISPAVRRIHGIMDRSFQGGGVFDETRIGNTGGHIANAVAEGVAINTLNVLADATAAGLPVDVHRQVVAHPIAVQHRRENAAVDMEIAIGTTQLRLDERAATNEIDFQHIEKVEDLKVRKTLQLEGGRVQIALSEEQGKADIGLNSARTADRHRLEHFDDVRKKLAQLRVEQEEVRTNSRLTEGVRAGLLNDLEISISKLVAQLNA